jgi:hypothetical protein
MSTLFILDVLHLNRRKIFLDFCFICGIMDLSKGGKFYEYYGL